MKLGQWLNLLHDLHFGFRYTVLLPSQQITVKDIQFYAEHFAVAILKIDINLFLLRAHRIYTCISIQGCRAYILISSSCYQLHLFQFVKIIVTFDKLVCPSHNSIHRVG